MKLHLLAALVALAGTTSTAAQEGAGTPPSDVPPTVQMLRRHMLDADVNALTFRSMDRLFTTRTVARSGPVREIPHADRPLSPSYRWDGATRDGEAFLERTFTNALVVIKDGRIVHEQYRNMTDAGTRFMAWSMTKTITALLVGAAVHEGRIKSIDDPVTAYLPELRGGGYDGVPIRAILEMRSGVDYEERYDFANPGVAARNHEAALVRNVARFADAARTITRAHPPGEVFAYKTLDTAVLGWLVERVSGMSVAAYTARTLWEPIGAEADGFYIMDGAPGVGREFSGAGFNATARDFARIGLLLLNEGKVGDRQVIPADWVRTAAAPARGQEDAKRGGYGFQIWTVPNAPAFYALGLQGQFIYVDPATRTVIVKMSYFPPDNGTAKDETLAYFAALSAWQPR